MKKITEYLCLLPFLMLFSTVFIVDNTMINGTVTGKIYWFYLSMALSSIAVSILYLINSKDAVLKFIDIIVIVFFITGFAVSAASPVTDTSKLNLFLTVTVLYFYFRFVLGLSDRARMILTIGFVCSGLALVLWGLSEYGKTGKALGSYTNSGIYAGNISLFFPVVLYYSVSDFKAIMTKTENRLLVMHVIRFILSVVTIGCIAYLLPETGNRTSLASVYLSSAVIAFIMFLTGVKKNRIKYAVMLLILFSSGFFYVRHSALKRTGSDSIMSAVSKDVRSTVWDISLITVKENKSGVGIGGFPGAFGKNNIDYNRNADSGKLNFITQTPYNEFMKIGVEFGIAGLLLFLSIIFYSIYSGIKNKAIDGLGGLIAITVFSMTWYPFHLTPFVICFVFFVTLCVSKCDETSRIRTESYLKHIIYAPILIGIFCVFTGGKEYISYKKWLEIRRYNTKPDTDIRDEYEKLYPELKNEVVFLSEYAKILKDSRLYDESDNLLKRALYFANKPELYIALGKNYAETKDYENAEICFENAIYLRPELNRRTVYPYYFLADVYLKSGKIKEARSAVKTILKVDKKSVNIKELRNRLTKIEKTNKEKPD